MPSPTCRVQIAIPTFRRPDRLQGLLRSLENLSVPPGVSLSVRVFDNCHMGSARPTVQAAMGGGFRLSYAIVPRRGLSSVRNAALEAAIADGAEFLGFIDDDEWPDTGWLEGHLATLAATGAAASFGAVVPVPDAPPPRWLRRMLLPRGPGLADGTDLAEGYTSNTVFSLAPVVAHRLRFDPRFDLTGGEDTAFFAAYRQTGARLVFCANAPVSEAIPRHRTTLAWHLRRWRRTGQTNARIRLEDAARPVTRIRCALSGVGRIGAGLVLACAGWCAGRVLPPLDWPRGLRIAARGMGYLDAVRGRHTAEYEFPDR